jgi:hypothetical protein
VGIAWLGAGGLLAVACLWEIFWRRRGFSPWVRDDWPAWAVARRSPLLIGKQALALVGASRLQTALDPDILSAVTGCRPVMLAVDGCSPLAVLSDLAADPAFTGTVICSLMPVWLAEPDGADDRSAKWIRKSRRLPGWAVWPWRLWIGCQGTLACLSPDLTPARILAAAKTGAWPLPHRAPMAPDRFRRLDTQKADLEQLRLARRRREAAIHAAARPLPPEPFEKRLARIEASVAAIQRRGGRVIFLRLPSSGAVREMEERTWPRTRYWDRLAAGTAAWPLHFEDHPQLTAFECPDDSHLGADDARRFTRELVGILRAGNRGQEREN